MEQGTKIQFCPYCGGKLDSNAKFCKTCGKPIVVVPDFPKNSDSEKLNERKTVYEGCIHKCPNCGELLDSFTSNCPSCGYEIRDAGATKSVYQLFIELNKADSIDKKIFLIRNYPIPNTKEDILEFMVLASTNIKGEENKAIFQAWLVKFEQAHKKALLIFKDDDNLAKAQEIYYDCQVTVNNEKNRNIRKFTINTVIRNIVVCIGIVLLIAAVVVDTSGGNSSLIQLVAYIVLISSATSLFSRKADTIDYLIGLASGVLIFITSALLYNGSMGYLCGVIVLIIVVSNFIKNQNQKSNEREE